MRQTEAAALSFASELKRDGEERNGEERAIWWADSSMFKKGVLSGASGRMSGVPMVHTREIFSFCGAKRMHGLMFHLGSFKGEPGREVKGPPHMVWRRKMS